MIQPSNSLPTGQCGQCHHHQPLAIVGLILTKEELFKDPINYDDSPTKLQSLNI